ncbi:MAG: MFS transporter [Lachnospiraceae bacterium]|nr:MFS transporter [Lachnospiraceae bacterium]
MKKYINTIKEMKQYLMLWASQAFSGLGSAMTSYSLVIWSYTQEGSALVTSMLMVCSYAPYVIFSIFAGALSDRWNKKKTMLVCDSIAAVTTVIVLILLQSGRLEIWHIYILNAVNGLMNTVQRPASDVAVSRICPKKYYQKIGGMQYLSSSLNSILTPIIATAILGIAGIQVIILFDLASFMVAFIVLALWIRIPEEENPEEEKEKLLDSVKEGIQYLKKERGIFDLILFLAAINLVASIYEAAFPAMVLSRNGGSEKALGMVNAVIGVSTLAGSFLATFMKEPKSRVRVICNTLLFSMSFENFMLGLSQNVWIWCLGGFLGWIFIPLMSTNLSAIMRLHIPQNMQGRVFAVRNSLQFFTIPIGYFLGGMLVDYVFEPIMAVQKADSLLIKIFGAGKGSGAAFLFFVIAFAGIGVCLYFRRSKYIWELEKNK